MSEHYDLSNVMARLPFLQRAALAAMEPSVGADAVDYWPYQQETFPYFWNRVERMAVTELSGDIEIHTYAITMALVIAHITQGYEGQNSHEAYRYIPAVLNYFRTHKDLVVDFEQEYSSPPEFLWTQRGGAMLTDIPNGTRPITNSGVGVIQAAVLFTLDVPLVWRVY